MKTPSVSVVLNVYKRGSKFTKQLEALIAQTAPISEFLVWENGEDFAPKLVNGVPVLKIARASENLGVWSRFAFALNATSDFVWVIDDDTVPGPRFLENALETFEAHPGVIGSRGLRFRSSRSYTLYDEFGPNSQNPKVERVDIVGHNWIFPREWLGYFWAEYSKKFESPLAGEDIHLSYAVQKHLGLGTFVPPHPEENHDLWGELADPAGLNGRDDVAISASSSALRRFEKAFSHYQKLGFTIQNTDQAGLRAWSLEKQVLAPMVALAPNFAHTVSGFLRFRKKPKS